MPEIVTCPECKRQLQVPEAFFGKNVQCPECKQTFLANPAGAAPKSTSAPTAPAPTVPASTVPAWEKPPSRALARDDDRPGKRRVSRRDDDDDDDDGGDDDRPRRRRLAEHRGGMILVFGVLAIVGVMPIFGPIAWFMGNADLRDMRAGRMDPSGEGQTNTGRILGMIATVLWVIGLIAGCAFFVFIFVASMAAVGAVGRHH